MSSSSSYVFMLVVIRALGKRTVGNFPAFTMEFALVRTSGSWKIATL